MSRASVCLECKERDNVCVLVASGEPCLGPVTHAGCKALCPSIGRGCFGCFGPAEDPNPEALTALFRGLGIDDEETARLLRTFNVNAPAFREESARISEGRR